jgi:hypothetical protein
MHSEELQETLISLAAEIMERSKSGSVSWQTVGGEPANYHIHFGNETSFVVCYLSSEDSETKAIISLKIGSVIAARVEAKQGEEHFASFKELFNEAHRAATRWDKAIGMIKEQIASGGALGDPAGDIPL